MTTAGASLANGMSYWISKNLSKPQEATCLDHRLGERLGGYKNDGGCDYRQRSHRQPVANG
ncbi:hypothetical protein LPN01_04805 [Sphingomonas sp. A2-49]|uniref:hypothetical protein n=1 Tax=Sphingomonas sp. A2-49 TaxID=1391375 RepID=UPI0021D17FBF|nr:hypothetical protein [Sphingomonas sp. A2-49]MCU6453391.1 hypothetical protein [Sphingomonas sp. A2-49]